MKHMKAQSKKLGNRIAAVAACTAMLGALGVNVVGNTFSASAVVANAGHYTSDYASLNDAREAGRELIDEIASEGIVLLKNEDNVLPLAATSRVTAMGRAYGRPVRDGGGSGSLNWNDLDQTWATSLQNAFGASNVGTAFTSNSDGGGNGTPSGTSTGSSTYTVNDARTQTFNNYSDAAILFFGRGGAENVMSSANYSDLTISGVNSPNGHILEFDNNERNLLQIANDNFDTVIVVINANNAMELGELMDDTYPNVKGVVWTGIPGPDGCNALGKVLTGEVNPSGRLVDTYVRDLTKDPTWFNFGTNAHVNSTFRFSGGTTTAYGIFYEEGIYLGYKYYETAWYEAEQGNYAGFDYDEAVVYPFGHGLSYTDFRWDILSNTSTETKLAANSEIEIKVKVTNTGNVAGKDVVELYYTPPYTSGGIEKAYKNLGDYGKTKLLQPGESDVITLNISLRDMASYDYDDKNGNGFRGYEVDAGEYVLHVSKDAHTSVHQLTYTADAARFTTSQWTRYEIKNQFDDVSEDFKAHATEFSRRDFAGTFPAAPTSDEMTVPSTFTDMFNKNNFNTANVFNDNATGARAERFRDRDNPWYVEDMPAYGVTPSDGLIMLGELTGLEFDDPLWDEFISQLTIDEMYSIINSNGAYSSPAVARLGIPATTDQDGPQQSGGGNVAGSNRSIPYVTEVVLAATWNEDLAYRMGRLSGNETMLMGIEVWYAPSMNTHRSAFGARNFEYYSEDGYLAATMGASETRGATDKGLIVTLKHYALNEQETARNAVSSFLTEQALREIYLKPFEYSVAEGGALGVMTAFNYIGRTWTGGSYGLNTEVLINEWGFHGLSVTDYGAGSGMLDLMIRAGGNRGMECNGLTNSAASPTHVAAMQNACHNQLYAKANSFAMQSRRMSGFDAITQGTASLDYTGKTLNFMTEDEVMEYLTVSGSTLGDTINYTVTQGTLPTGLTLDSDGLLHGTPTAESSATFTVTATGASGGRVYSGVTATAQFTINVTATRTEYDPKAMLDGRVGVAYSDHVHSAVGGDYTYEVTSGNLPAGLSMDTEGNITGTPTAAGSFTFTVTATSGEIVLTREFTIVIVAADAKLSYEAIALNSARIGESYTANLGRATGAGTVTYTLHSADSLPEGFTLSANGTLTGTAVEPGTYSFRVVASALNFDNVIVRWTLIVVGENASLSYTDGTLNAGRVGAAYTASVATATGAGNITYTATGLPSGVMLNADGTLTGTPAPSAVGNYTVTVTASAQGFQSVTAEFTLQILEGLFGYTNKTLAEGKVNTAYRASITLSDSSIADVSYELKEGSALPAGLTLNNRGEVTGMPTAAGTYTFVIVASADGYMTREATFTIFVSGANSSNSSSGSSSGKSDGGCGGVIGFGSAAVAASIILGAALAVRKKKEEQD